ncbi:DNA-binding protein [Rhodopseudomonas sp. B29]|uniref:helix-turn-helix domain-containing transcriptional regulator n=1 Tax=Rhodopseudomonas sp. B29 TaxID=95607 RepID=UPI00034CDE8B|nr:transcriptional regulator [Rhodopseudomonas sp. B29]
MLSTTPFDATDYLDSPEMIAAYLDEAFESGDSTLIAKAIKTVMRVPENRRRLPSEMLTRIAELTTPRASDADQHIKGDDDM